LTFVVRATNIGNVQITADITIEIPQEMTPNGTFTFTAVIPAGESWTQSLDAVVNDGFIGTLTARVTATTDAGIDAESIATINVENSNHNLQLTVEAIPSPVASGGLLTYQI